MAYIRIVVQWFGGIGPVLLAFAALIIGAAFGDKIRWLVREIPFRWIQRWSRRINQKELDRLQRIHENPAVEFPMEVALICLKTWTRLGFIGAPVILIIVWSIARNNPHMTDTEGIMFLITLLFVFIMFFSFAVFVCLQDIGSLVKQLRNYERTTALLIDYLER
jgi:large-conductance mechanosensitive channel